MDCSSQEHFEQKNAIRFLDPPAVDERNATRLGEICKERFGDEWDILSIKSPGHVLSLVEEAQRIGLDLGLNATPLALRRMRQYESVFFFHYSREHSIDFLEHTHTRYCNTIPTLSNTGTMTCEIKAMT